VESRGDPDGRVRKEISTQRNSTRLRPLIPMLKERSGAFRVVERERLATKRVPTVFYTQPQMGPRTQHKPCVLAQATGSLARHGRECVLRRDHLELLSFWRCTCNRSSSRRVAKNPLSAPHTASSMRRGPSRALAIGRPEPSSSNDSRAGLKEVRRVATRRLPLNELLGLHAVLISWE
jgi:hypothetical protein